MIEPFMETCAMLLVGTVTVGFVASISGLLLIGAVKLQEWLRAR